MSTFIVLMNEQETLGVVKPFLVKGYKPSHFLSGIQSEGVGWESIAQEETNSSKLPIARHVEGS